VSAVRETLNDHRWGVVRMALLCLQRNGLLRVADVEPFFRHRRPAARILALQLTHEGELATIRTPVDLLRDPNRDVRYCAIGRCRGQRDRQNVSTLIEMLSQESDGELAEQIIFALAHFRDPEALPVLLEMTEHRDSIVRYHAITALGTLGDPRTIRTLTALLEDQTKPERSNEHGRVRRFRSVRKFRRTIGQEARAALAQIRA
jgi:HEAT repeat protein